MINYLEYSATKEKDKKNARLRKLVRQIFDDGMETWWLSDDEVEELKKLSNWREKK